MRDSNDRPRTCRLLELTCKLTVLATTATILVSSLAFADERDDLNNATMYYGVREYERALDIIDHVLDDREVSSQMRLDALVLRARCQVRTGQKDAAIAAYLDALAINPRWKPDPALYQADEVAAFDLALAEFSIEPPPAHCPSKTTPLVATGLFSATLVFYFASSQDADERWDEYASDVNRSPVLYDEYDSAVRRTNTLGIASLVTGIGSGYLWYRYIKQHRDCSRQGNGGQLGFDLTPTRAVVCYRF